MPNEIGIYKPNSFSFLSFKPSPSDPPISPAQFEVRARTTQLPSPFVMAFSNPEQDVDVSAQMHSSAYIEPGITWVW